MEDGILYDLPHIKRDVFNDSMVQQGALGSHFTYISSQNKAGSDDVTPSFGNIGQILGLKMHYMLLTVGFPLTLTIGEHSEHFGVVRVFLKSIVHFFTN